MLLSGAISIRRLLRRSAITIGYGSGLPHDATGRFRSPVAGGIGGSVAPLDTIPAPFGSSMPPVSATSAATRGDFQGGSAASAAGTAADTASAAASAAKQACRSDAPFSVGTIVVLHGRDSGPKAR